MTAASANAIAESIARTAIEYDAVPYSSFPFARLQPERMAAVSKLLGLQAASPKTARTLEIGCASGGHLIPLAARYPEAEFVGIDISGKQIADGQHRIDRLELKNIMLRTLSLTELDAKDGKFDYIICHGVYSWIPPEIREALLRVCKERLAADGIAVISYNVLPGWRMFQAVRDSMLLHVKNIPTHEQRIAEMRRLFALLAEHTNEATTYAAIWRKEAPRMVQQPDAYLAHELLEENNAPCTFSEFASAAIRHGFAYLGETTLMAGIPENSGAIRGALIRALADNDYLAIEQYIDIVVGRTFRQSMLVHDDRKGLISRVPSAELIDDLQLVAPLALKITPADNGSVWSIDDGEGSISETTEKLVADAMREIVARQPASSSFSDLCQEQQPESENCEKVREGLMRLVCMGILEASVEPIHCAFNVPTAPKIWPLAASDAEAGLQHTATLRHSPFEISPQARFLMRYCDGSRDEQALVSQLFEFVQGGGVQISEHGVPVTDPERLREICAGAVNRQLVAFVRAGLLVES